VLHALDEPQGKRQVTTATREKQTIIGEDHQLGPVTMETDVSARFPREGLEGYFSLCVSTIIIYWGSFVMVQFTVP
jgi:hypothetical protein